MENSKKCFFIKNGIFFEKNKYIFSFKKNIFNIFYIVKKKDTLYSLSKNFGYDYQQLLKFNSFKKPYKILIGQKILIEKMSIKNINCLSCILFNYNKKIKKKYDFCNFFLKKILNVKNLIKKNQFLTKICSSCKKKIEKKYILNLKKKIITSHNWCWPIKNLNKKNFSHFQVNNRQGIEISGFRGQPIFSISSGKVVYVDNYFENYGRLIIIKHRNNYLSIYGFNQSVFVKENDRVYKNQKISTMGILNNKSGKLYFEIRYKGEPINPFNLLPILKK